MLNSSSTPRDSRAITPNSRRRAWISGLMAACALCLAVGLVWPVAAQNNADSGQAKGKKNGKSQPSDSSRKDNNAKGMEVARRVVLVFPPDTKGGKSDQVADVIVDVVESRLHASDAYTPVYFLTSLPTVRKALTEATLTQADVKNPFDSDAKIKKVAQIAGYNMALVTSIDDYQYDATKNQVNMVLSARLIDLASGTPRAAAESGSSPTTIAKSATELSLAQDVARNLTEKLMTSLLPASKPAPAPTSTKKSKR